MNKIEFAKGALYLEEAFDCSINARQPGDEPYRKRRMDIYFDALSDIPNSAWELACKRCVMERKYTSFPPVAELRELAIECVQGVVQEMTGIEAFGLAMSVINKIDTEVDGWHEKLLRLPKAVQAAIRAVGFRSIYNIPSANREAARAQFARAYDAIKAREKRERLCTDKMRKQLEGVHAKLGLALNGMEQTIQDALDDEPSHLPMLNFMADQDRNQAALAASAARQHAIRTNSNGITEQTVQDALANSAERQQGQLLPMNKILGNIGKMPE